MASASAGILTQPHYPLRQIRLGDGPVEIDRRPDGTIYIRQKKPIGPYADKLTERLVHWAGVAPERTYLAARADGGEWRRIGYAQALESVRRLGQALLDLKLTPERPLLILSGNDLEHALLGLASYHVGIPYAPIAPAYSTVSTDFAKLRDVVALLKPGLVFASSGQLFAAAIRAVIPDEVPILVTRDPLVDRPCGLFRDLLATLPTRAVDDAFARVGPDTVAKYLFTSGSTGTPKAVINTQRMLCSNQEMVRNSYAFLQDEPPVLLDWSPWNHTAAGNKTFGLVLYNGGTLYLDDGRPTPSGAAATARNLREIAPTWYFNVPKGYDELVPYLERDRELRRAFFSRLKMMMYAGAGLAQHTWDALDRMSAEVTGERILLCTGLGATETAPFALMCTTEQRIAGNIGIPAVGVELKLVPSDGKLEARLRGPNVTPGYFGDPVLTAEAFDEEGFYKMGDALRFADPSDPGRGLYFDGRIKENFKLRTGTWVGVGALRARFIDHFGPLVRDVVIAGLDRDYLAGLVVPNIARCRTLAPELGTEARDAEVLAAPSVREPFEAALRSFAQTSTGSSTLVRAILLLPDPLSLDRGEITDKGSINQRAILSNHAQLVEELYSGSSRVIAV